MAEIELNHEDYTVGWVCPLEVELIAALEMLDKEHKPLEQAREDSNAYRLGEINGHNVVVATLPVTGNTPTATVVTQMRRTFPQLRFGLLVGIGGGVPTKTNSGHVRLGHVVVSKPEGEHSGAVQYDHGKAQTGGFRRTGFLAPPPNVLLAAAQQLAANRARSRKDPLLQHISRIDTSIKGLRKYRYPGLGNDILYRPDYIHRDPTLSCKKCGCDPKQSVSRLSTDDSDDSDNEDDGAEDDENIVIHRGTVASGELVIKDGLMRDELAKQHGILCFEMEAAGALAEFPCIVIRGISDYSDSHKNDKWHGYAAAVAAAYARELFFHMPVNQVKLCSIPQEDMERIKSRVENTNTNVQEIAKKTTDEEVRRLFLPPNVSSNYEEALRKRHDGTGDWFLQSEEFLRWKTSPGSFLWLRGTPGCGKTVLSASIIEKLQKDAETSSKTILYFFFTFSDESKRSVQSMACSFIFRLYHKFKSCAAKHVSPLVEACKDGFSPGAESLLMTLHSIMNEIGEVTFVLDALDECETLHDLILWLRRMHGKKTKGFHFIVTSRPQEHVDALFKGLGNRKWIVRLEEYPINEDIQVFVRKCLQETYPALNSKYYKLAERMRRWEKRGLDVECICDDLAKKAGGMFRWVVCQLDTLKKCRKLGDFNAKLGSLPETLEKTYSRILDEVSEDDKQDCVRILQFLMFSERPLTLGEVKDLLAISLENEVPFNPSNRMTDEDILGVCSSLVTTNEAKPPFLGRSKNLEIKLAHLSVKEYLSSPRLTQRFQKCLAEPKARQTIVELSLAYLSTIDDHVDQVALLRRRRYFSYGSRREDISSIIQRLPFAEYAARYWIDHASVAEENESVRHRIVRFFFPESQTQYNNWLRLFDPDDLESAMAGNDLDSRWYGIPSPLYYSTLRGLIHTTKELIDAGTDINGGGGRLGTALQVACLKGHKKIAKLLLDKGANVNATVQQTSGTALMATMLNANEYLARLLLQRGANPNLQGRQWIRRSRKWDISLPLHFASSNGLETLVQLLLDYKAKPESKSLRFKDSALFHACHNGYEGVVRRLLANGAVVDFEEGSSRTPLIAASRKGHIEVMKLLLEYGADPNHQCVVPGNRSSPLREACLGRQIEAIRLLCDKGAGFNGTLDELGNALGLVLNHDGSYNRHDEDTAIVLVTKSAISERYTNPVSYLKKDSMDEIRDAYRSKIVELLQVASKRQFTRLYGLLDDLSIDVNIKPMATGGPLPIICQLRRKQTVSELLRNFAGVIPVPNSCGSPLHAASSKGDLEIVQLLLKKEADPRALDFHGWSAWMIATHHGHADIAQELETITKEHAFSSCLNPSGLILVAEDTSISHHWREMVDTVSTGCIQLWGKAINDFTSGCIKHFRANHPFVPTTPYAYFETRLMTSGAFAIGVYQDNCKPSNPNHSLMALRYSSAGSIDGQAVTKSHQWMEYHEGDTVGFGVDYTADAVFFTKNGQCSEKICNALKGRLFAAIDVQALSTIEPIVNFKAVSPYNRSIS